MKKRIISMLLAAVLMLSLMPAALAEGEEENCYLGNVTAGQSFRCHIADIGPDAEIGAVILPDGCRIELEQNTAGTKVYLAGRVDNPGYVLFTLPIVGFESYNINCSMQVLADTPTVTTSADITCRLGDTSLISVSVSGGGSISYQWYSVSSGIIPGATGNTYSPNTFLVGTQEYYCEVTSTTGGIGTIVRSANIKVNVYGASTVSEISVAFLPDKLEYSPGEPVDTTGLILSVRYSDGTTSTVTNGFDVYPAILTANGRQNIEVRYGNCTCTYQVTVGRSGDIEGIGVLERPDKTMYKVGESLDPTGLVVRAYFKGSGYEDIGENELECSPKKFTSSGQQTVTVQYAGKTCTFTVTVEDEKKELRVVSLPYKTEYTVGDKLDTAGLAISIQSGGRTETVSAGFTCTPKVLTTAGTQEITVIYGGVNKCTFNVTVKEKETKPTPSPSARPTPTPSASPAFPATASPVPTPVRHESHTTNFAGTLMKIVLVIAIFCLVGIGAYIAVTRKKQLQAARPAAPVQTAPAAPAVKPEPAPKPEAPKTAPEAEDDKLLDSKNFAEDWDDIKK